MAVDMTKENDEIVRRFEEAFSANDEATIDELCDPGLVDHNPAPDQEPTLAGLKKTIAMYRSVFPDARTELHAVIGEADLVATRWTVTGTQTAEFFGIPATGKTMTAEGMNFYRVSNGKITDVWTQFDALGMMQQLGVIPT